MYVHCTYIHVCALLSLCRIQRNTSDMSSPVCPMFLAGKTCVGLKPFITLPSCSPSFPLSLLPPFLSHFLSHHFSSSCRLLPLLIVLPATEVQVGIDTTNKGCWYVKPSFHSPLLLLPPFSLSYPSSLSLCLSPPPLSSLPLLNSPVPSLCLTFSLSSLPLPPLSPSPSLSSSLPSFHS